MAYISVVVSPRGPRPPFSPFSPSLPSSVIYPVVAKALERLGWRLI